jgi:carboxypeptidase C (cathepsin A)
VRIDPKVRAQVEEKKVTTEHEPPRGASKKDSWNGLDYTATAKWIVLRKKEKPAAEIFSIAYVKEAADAGRPVTFTFNGGPGAASAFLHLGAVGPRRIAFPTDGTIPAMPLRLVQNDESWLGFTDIVFVDPIGTGFSRVIQPADGSEDSKKKGEEHNPKAYFGVKADLEAMCEFISRWLSENGRWGSAVFIAGESYGGYRVGRLTRMLQEKGIGLNGSILISPALEPAHLCIGSGWGDYEVVPWVHVLPTMAATAAYHGRSRVFKRGTQLEEVLKEAEAFARGAYASFLASGAAMPAAERDHVLGRFADLVGLELGCVTRAEGRVRVEQFARELLRSEGKVVGRYDGTVTTSDPFPDRDVFAGADPTLSGFWPTFTTAVNRLLRSELGVETDREYKLLELEVIMSWKNDESTYYIEMTQGAVDDFRFGMAMNPHMKAFITHGWYDLMTPYYSSDRMRNLMRLDQSVARRLTVRHFNGGHMFYQWEESRKAFTAAITSFMADAMECRAVPAGVTPG